METSWIAWAPPGSLWGPLGGEFREAWVIWGILGILWAVIGCIFFGGRGYSRGFIVKSMGNLALLRVRRRSAVHLGIPWAVYDFASSRGRRGPLGALGIILWPLVLLAGFLLRLMAALGKSETCIGLLGALAQPLARPTTV